MRLRSVLSAYGAGTALTGGGWPGSVGHPVQLAYRGHPCPLATPSRQDGAGRVVVMSSFGGAPGGWEKSLGPDRYGGLQVTGFGRSGRPSGVTSNGEPSFSLPTLPARPERRLTLKAPCAVLPGWARQAAQGGRAVSADRSPPEPKAASPAGRCPHRKPTKQTATARAPSTSPSPRKLHKLQLPHQREKSPYQAGYVLRGLPRARNLGVTAAASCSSPPPGPQSQAP